MTSQHPVLMLLKLSNLRVGLLEVIFTYVIIIAFLLFFLLHFLNKKLSKTKNKKIKTIINFFYTPKNYIENFNLNDIDDPQFKIAISAFLIAIYFFSLLFLLVPIILIFSNKIEFQYIILKYFGLAFSGFIAIGTIGMTIAIAHELKDNKEKETSKEINAAKHFFNRIKIHIEHLEKISQDLIFYEKQGYPFDYDRTLKIFNNLQMLPSTIIDTPEYNPEFLYLIKNPCFHFLEEYYNYFSILNEDRKKISDNLISTYRNIFFMYKDIRQNFQLNDLGNDDIDLYAQRNLDNNIQRFIESIYIITIFWEQTPGEHLLKLKTFMDSPIYIIIIGYRCLFCIMEKYSLTGDEILKNYNKIKNNIQEIDLRISNNNLKVVITESLKVIKEIDENYKNILDVK